MMAIVAYLLVGAVVGLLVARCVYRFAWTAPLWFCVVLAVGGGVAWPFLIILLALGQVETRSG